jgi:hypothetical protein
VTAERSEPVRRRVKVTGYVPGELIPPGMFEAGELTGLDEDGRRYVGLFHVEDLQDLELTTEQSARPA